MRYAKVLGAAGALITAALVGGTLIGSTLAVGEEDGDSRRADAAAYCDTFMDTLASELGTTRDGLVAAGKTAAGAAIDAAVAAGDITEERATRMRERVAAADGEGCAWFGRGGFGGGGHGRGDHGPRGPGHAGGVIHGEALEAAADALGLEASDLPAAIRDAGSLEALATAEGVAYDDVKTAVLAAVQSDLGTAVADGRITQEHADSILEKTTTWLDEGGELRGRHGRDGHNDEASHEASPAASPAA